MAWFFYALKIKFIYGNNLPFYVVWRQSKARVWQFIADNLSVGNRTNDDSIGSILNPQRAE